ncbi:MAG TPA: hypothetical protein VG408_09885 [Actinomycetota bacterium]|nr:hypothetical protein [Actinomycetota bacterium]
MIVGLGLALSAEQLIDLERSGVPVRWEHVPLFTTYLALALPFSHASVRYLDLTYLGRSVGATRTVADIIYGGGNFIWLIALAFFVSRPVVFGWSMVICSLEERSAPRSFGSCRVRRGWDSTHS